MYAVPMLDRQNDSLLRDGWRSFFILMGGWTLPAVMVGLGVYAIQRSSGQEAPLAAIFARQLWYYWLFAAVCPVLYQLQARWPFTRGSWPRSLLAHAVVAAIVIVVVMALSGLAAWAVSMGEAGAPRELIVREFTSQQGQYQVIVHLFYFTMAVGLMMIVRLNRQRQREEERAAELALRASRLEAQVSRARLKALEMQLNPHFLFNALNSIASLVQQKKTDPAYEAIAILGELLRETIHAGDRHSIPLGREIRQLGKYLDLERMRFSDRMRASIDVAPDCHEAIVPAMILQPLVENAIRHGISKRPESGLLEIAVRRQQSRLVIVVRDDGPGLPDRWTLDNGAGVGLKNLRDRLVAHFEAEFELTLEPNRSQGAVARVSFPFRTAQQEKQ